MLSLSKLIQKVLHNGIIYTGVGHCIYYWMAQVYFCFSNTWWCSFTDMKTDDNQRLLLKFRMTNFGLTLPHEMKWWTPSLHHHTDIFDGRQQRSYFRQSRSSRTHPHLYARNLKWSTQKVTWCQFTENPHSCKTTIKVKCPSKMHGQWWILLGLLLFLFWFSF